MVETRAHIREVVDQYVKLLAQQGIRAERVFLYGSYARGTAHDGSDVDLVVISKDFQKFSSLELLEFLARVAWKCDAPLEVMGYTPDELKDKEGKSIFWDEVRTTGQVIYEAA